jgi:hypothetical protein
MFQTEFITFKLTALILIIIIFPLIERLHNFRANLHTFQTQGRTSYSIEIFQGILFLVTIWNKAPTLRRHDVRVRPVISEKYERMLEKPQSPI